MNQKNKDLYEELSNAIFPSKENDGIEHIDMSYKDFMRLLKALASD